MNCQSNMYLIIVGIFLVSYGTLCSKTATKSYSSYRRYPWCTPSDYIRYPQSVPDVINIVHEAISRGVTVKVFGRRHSQTDIICTEGIPVDNRGLRFFKMNYHDNTATFGSGVSLRETTEYLRRNGRALRTIPAYGNITLGGAIGTGAHGSTIKYNASISSQVVGLTIVNGRGKVQHISNSEDLKAFRIHLGLLGIVVDVTLYTVPLYKTRAYNHVVTDEILTNGVAINWAKTTDQIALYWFPSFEEVVVANWTIVDVNTAGDAYTYDHVPSTYENLNIISYGVKETAFSLTSSPCALASTLGYTILHVLEYILELSLVVQTPDWVPIYTEDGFTVLNPAVGYYDLMFAPVCSETPQGILGEACVWAHGSNSITVLDSEFGLALWDLPAFITDVKDIISKTPTVFPLQGILMRFSDQSDIYMSMAYGRQTVHFEFYMWNRKDRYNDPSGSLAGYQTILQTLAKKYNGRSHWGKSGLVYHNSPSLDMKLDPVAREKFIDAMNKYDPNEVFINNFGRRMKRKSTKVDIDPLTTRCALLDNCFCSANTDCGSNQICTSLLGYPYRVCKTKNEIASSKMNKSKFPPLLGVVGYFLNEVPNLAKAAFAKCKASDAVGVVTDIVDRVLG